MIDWSSCSAVEQDPARVSGAWLFRGTRVPVAALFENLEDDASVREFVDWFPGVTMAQARVVLEYAARSTQHTANGINAGFVRSRYACAFTPTAFGA